MPSKVRKLEHEGKRGRATTLRCTVCFWPDVVVGGGRRDG
jgi:hypothetical protein